MPFSCISDCSNIIHPLRFLHGSFSTHSVYLMTAFRSCLKHTNVHGFYQDLKQFIGRIYFYHIYETLTMLNIVPRILHICWGNKFQNCAKPRICVSDKYVKYLRSLLASGTIKTWSAMINNSPLSIHRIRKGKKQQQKFSLWIFSSIGTDPKGPIQLVYVRVHLESSRFVLWIWRDVYAHPVSGGFHSSSFAWTGPPLSSFLHLPDQNSLILSYSLWNTIQTFYATFSRKLPLSTLVEFPILIYSSHAHPEYL